MDFIIKKYKSLIKALQRQGYFFQTFKEFINNQKEKAIILRHDVDKLPHNSLRFAQIQYEYGIKGSYYFRMVPQSYNEEVIKKIGDLGHEIGYHYEDMDFSAQRQKTKDKRQKLAEEDLYDVAIEIFQENLEKLRKLYTVKTICMHGSPLSKFDNKSIWNKYDYKDYGIIGEPYFDIDFNEVFYITDTGRRWDGGNVSIRDKVDSKFNLSFRHTKDILQNIDKLPDKIMFTFHPQRWNNRFMPWFQELISQNIKNQVKKYYIKRFL